MVVIILSRKLHSEVVKGAIKTILSIENESSNNTRKKDYYLHVTYTQQHQVTKFY